MMLLSLNVYPQRKKELKDIENDIAEKFPQDENTQLLEFNKTTEKNFVIKDIKKRY